MLPSVGFINRAMLSMRAPQATMVAWLAVLKAGLPLPALPSLAMTW